MLNPRVFTLGILIGASLLFSSSRAGAAPAPHSAPSTPSNTVLITAIYFDPFVTGEASEAIQLQNVSELPLAIGGWKLTDNEGTIVFPLNSTLSPHQKIWVSKSASAFRQEFGIYPAYEYGGNTVDAVPDMTGTAPSLDNNGDEVILKDAADQSVDAVPYRSGVVASTEWDGASVNTYALGCTTCSGQILYRKMRESDGLPVADTDRASDWAQDTGDNYLGKRVQSPGWDVDEFFQTAKGTETASLKYCVAPDNLFDCYRDEILKATTSVEIEAYSLNNASIVDVLTRTIASGVGVRILLDDGALDDQGRWACEQIEKARGSSNQYHGECWFMDSKPQAHVTRRYSNLHGKWTIVDGTALLVGSENLGDDAMPSDNKSDGTAGTRGGYLITDSPTLIARAQAIFDRDLDPANHADVRRWGTNTDDFPPLGFVPSYVNGGNTYVVQFANPFTATETQFSFEMVQCPENCLRMSDALLGMVAQAGAGDTLLVEQLYEYKYWGAGSSNAVADPNLRLEAYLDAARRGAHVKILLDSFYDSFSDPRSNYQTCVYVNSHSAYYSIKCKVGNPAGHGIHMKLVALKHGSAGFVHLGSINGSETSSKLNRELATQVESASAYNYWEQVFNYDWSVSPLSPHAIFLPLTIIKDAP